MIALALALLAAAPAPASREPGVLVEKVLAEIEAWDPRGAVLALDELMQADADSVMTAWLQGKVLFEQGKYDDAVAAFDEANKRLEQGKPAGDITQALRRDRALAKSTAAEVKGDDVHESAHFTLLTHKGKDALLAPYALEGLEKAYAALTADLGFQPEDKIRVEVYESAQALARVSPLTVAEIKASGTIALCKYNRLMITTPRALLRGYPWMDTLAHEFTHYLVSKKGRGNVPIWLQEGLAKFLETRWRGEPGQAVDAASLALLLKAARSNTLIPFAKMHPSIAKLPTQEAAALAFAEVEAAIKLLYDRGGQPALTALVGAMAKGATDEEAVGQAFGKGFASFESEWKREVARPRTSSATAARAQKVKKYIFKEDAKGRATASERAEGPTLEAGAISDAEAKKGYRLGEIMLARRRWAAAVLEYGKARARVKDQVPALSRRYALACIQTGQMDEALSALVGATTTDPTDEAAQALLAHVYLEKKDLAKARAALDAGIAVDPFDPDLHRSYLDVARGLNDQALAGREAEALSLATGQKISLKQPAAPPAAKDAHQ